MSISDEEYGKIVELRIGAEAIMPDLFAGKEDKIYVDPIYPFREVKLSFYTPEEGYDYFPPGVVNDFVGNMNLEIAMLPSSYEPSTIAEKVTHEEDEEEEYPKASKVYQMLTDQYAKERNDVCDNMITMVYLRELYISPKYRNKGLAKYILLRLPTILRSYFNISCVGYIGTYIEPCKNQQDFEMRLIQV